MKRWAPRLALRKRLKVIRKWPIVWWFSQTSFFPFSLSLDFLKFHPQVEPLLKNLGPEWDSRLGGGGITTVIITL